MASTITAMATPFFLKSFMIYQPRSSMSFCLSSPSMRPSSTSASRRFWAPSFWIWITSSKVEISCWLVC